MKVNTRALLASCWAILFAGALLLHCSATPTPGPTPDAGVAADAGGDGRLDAPEPPTTDGSAAACGIPPGLTLYEEPRCSTSPGLFTDYSVSLTARTYHVATCNVAESEVPKNQAEFDHIEANAPFLKSNRDFVHSVDCASGSVTLDSGNVVQVVWIRQR